eukprot:GILJ01010485.1.p1 GENE.GILJ01010485.1~~GILJ01010485.1.p1  ORF type:complete len:407 (+),score=61.00 GILJ01010485.1:43-1221(+)
MATVVPKMRAFEVMSSAQSAEMESQRARGFTLSPESEKLQQSIVGLLKKAQKQDPKTRFVVFQFYVNKILKVDDVSQQVEIDFYLKLNWISETCVGMTDAQFQEKKGWENEDFWHPGVELSNGIQVEKNIEFAESFWVEFPVHGVLAYTQRYTGTIAAVMDLKHFPFDLQAIPLHSESFHWKAEDMRMLILPQHHRQRLTSPEDSWLTMSKDIHMVEWDIQCIEVDSTIYHYEFEDRSYSRVSVKIHLIRDYAYYFTKVLYVLILLVVMSWSVFFMDPTDLSGRTGITVTLFLAAVAFNFVVGSALPKVSYSTSLDWYLLVSYVFIFLSLIENIVIYRIHKLYGQEEAEYADYLMLIAFPVVYAAYTLLWVVLALRKRWIYKRRLMNQFDST